MKKTNYYRLIYINLILISLFNVGVTNLILGQVYSSFNNNTSFNNPAHSNDNNRQNGKIISAGNLSQSITVPANSISTPIDMYMQSREANLRQALTYTIVNRPVNGTLSGFPKTIITDNGLASPEGLTYTPKAGFTGTDQFTISVTGTNLSYQKTFIVDINNYEKQPVVDLRLIKEDGNAVLRWTTKTTDYLDRFIIERSTNGQNYSTVQTLDASVNNNSTLNYNFIDKTPVHGTNYYRITGIDRNGASVVFPLRSIDFTDNEVRSFRIYPNPVTTGVIQLSLNAPAGSYNLVLFNEAGQLVHSQYLNHIGARADYRINVPATVKSGNYNFVIENPEARLAEKVLIQ